MPAIVVEKNTSPVIMSYPAKDAPRPMQLIHATILLKELEVRPLALQA
jgi:hypothetical protein